MYSKYLFVASALLLAAACGPEAAIAPSSGKTLPRAPAATILTTTPVLWDQSGGTSDHMWVGDGINALMADDFIVGTGSTWRISEVMLSGMVLKIPIAFEIARSAGPNPSGDVIHNYALPPFASVPSLCAPTCGLRDYLFKLPTPLVLEPGHYWLVVVTAGNPFLWHDRPPISSTERPVWRLDEAFGGAWVGLTSNDLSFALYGADRTPVEYAEELTTTIQQFNLHQGTANSLNAKLRAALTSLENGDTNGACSALQDLINESNAQSGKKLTEDQASAIGGRAAFIRELIGC